MSIDNINTSLLEMKKSAGIIFIYKKKLLLCHPTNAKWYNTYTVPKGEVEVGELEIDGAIRETKEEVGIIVDKNKLSKEPIIIDYKKKTGEVYKQLYLYKYIVNDVSEIGLNESIWTYITAITVKKEQLQLKEIDWAGFLDITEASKRIFWRQSELLKLIE